MAKFLLAVDVGTSGTRTTLFDFTGQVHGNYVYEYETTYPVAGGAEHDVREWWRAVCKGVSYFKNELCLSVEEIAAVGVDGLSWAALPVDKKGQPLRRAMIWLDRRAEKQADWIKDTAGEKIEQISGNPIDAAYITPKMLWIKENEPHIYEKTHKFLQSNGYIVYRLTGEFSLDYSQGYGFHFFNIKQGEWSGDTAARLNLSLEKLPPFYECHQVVGSVTNRAARETGLPEGTPVVAGGLDAACCTLGAGVIKSGMTQEQGGQAGGMSIQLSEPVTSPRLILGYHVIPDHWLLQGGTVGGGGTLNWFRKELGSREKRLAEKQGGNAYQIMDREAAEIPPGSDGLIFLPYMAGERSPIWDSKARGVFFGLSYDKTRAHMIRAMMEGVGFSLLHNLETAQNSGVEIKELNSVGGASGSEVWTGMKSDITGKRINVPQTDQATALGTAILAGVGTGIYDSFSEAVNQMIKIEKTYGPDEKRHRIYQKYYSLYRELYEKLKDSYERLYSISKIAENAFD